MPNSGFRAFLFQFCQHTPPVHYTWPTVGSGLPWRSDVWAAIPEWAGIHQEEEGGEERASVLEPWQAFRLSSRATGTHLELHCTVEVNPQHFFDGRDDVLVHGSPGQHCKPKPTTKRSLVSLRISGLHISGPQGSAQPNCDTSSENHFVKWGPDYERTEEQQ